MERMVTVNYNIGTLILVGETLYELILPLDIAVLVTIDDDLSHEEEAATLARKRDRIESNLHVQTRDKPSLRREDVVIVKTT